MWKRFDVVFGKLPKETMELQKCWIVCWDMYGLYQRNAIAFLLFKHCLTVSVLPVFHCFQRDSMCYLQSWFKIIFSEIWEESQIVSKEITQGSEKNPRITTGCFLNFFLVAIPAVITGSVRVWCEMIDMILTAQLCYISSHEWW